ncbi:MAG: hypothetical protein KDB27_07005 [Planctomycetales bacterium]|nr:hypothetical protein [Planctomycetales bacterium]
MKTKTLLTLLVCSIFCFQSHLHGLEVRSTAHAEYTGKLWDFVQSAKYHNWSQFRGEFPIENGPGDVGESVVYLNSRARKDLQNMTPGSAIICEHTRGDEVAGITVYALPSNRKETSWYWAHYLPSGEVVKTSADRNPFDKDAFFTTLVEGRLWVFPLGSEDLAEFKASGEPAKCVTLPGAGPGGLTVKSSSKEVIQDYMAAREGFATKIVDERVWVFREGTTEAEDLKNGKFSEKHITRIGAGPMGMTIKSSDAAVIDDYLTRKTGFETSIVDERLWVFRSGSEEWQQFQSEGASDKHVTQVGTGPGGLTVKSPDSETIVAYMTSANGFATFIEDGRLWVFLDNTEALKDFKESGEPAKCVTRVGEGPLGMTVKSDDASTIDLYLAAVAQ